MRVIESLRNAGLDLITTLANGGTLRIYDDTAARPATADTPIPGGSVLLAELTMGSPSFGAASGGDLTANAITEEASAPASGTALYARLADSGDGAIMDFGISTAPPSNGSELQIPSLAIVSGQEVTASSLVISHEVGA